VFALQHFSAIMPTTLYI